MSSPNGENQGWPGTSPQQGGPQPPYPQGYGQQAPPAWGQQGPMPQAPQQQPYPQQAQQGSPQQPYPGPPQVAPWGQAAAPGQYGGFPNAGMTESPAVRGPVPPTVRLAVSLMFFCALINAVADLIEMFVLGRSSGGAGGGLALGGLIGVIGVALWIWMALANRSGHHWARVLSTVFFGLYAADVTVLILAAVSELQLYLQLIMALGGLVIVVLMWLPSSRAHYAASR